MFVQIKSTHIFKTLNLRISTFLGSFKIVLVNIYSFNYIQVLEAFYNLKFVFNPESSFQYTGFHNKRFYNQTVLQKLMRF